MVNYNKCKIKWTSLLISTSHHTAHIGYISVQCNSKTRLTLDLIHCVIMLLILHSPYNFITFVSSMDGHSDLGSRSRNDLETQIVNVSVSSRSRQL